MGVSGSGLLAGTGRRIAGGCENYDCRRVCAVEMQAGVRVEVASVCVG